MMRILVAGATGTLGRPVVAQLIAKGHEVLGLTRSAAVRRGQQPGLRFLEADALDAKALQGLFREHRPEVVVHLLTAIPPGGPTRPAHMRPTNVLRMAGTANLIAAATACGARRIVGESFVGVHGPGAAEPSDAGSGPGAGRVPLSGIDEGAPLVPVTRGPMRATVDALRSLESQLLEARRSGALETTALRIGLLYGADVPSTALMIEQARAGRLFAPRAASGLGAFVHQHDAAAGIVAAIEAAHPGPVYHLVDDEPMGMNRFVEELARSVSGRPPRTVPAWLVRLAAPVVGEMISARLVLSNARAKRELEWVLRYPTIHEGLRTLAAGPRAAA
ncbi:MAG: NAD-dependent epimerase/dehydratase family protein [Vicinamibacterales bacterium]